MLDDEPLGQGGYGAVYRAIYRGTVIAAKVLNEQNALHMSEECKQFLFEFKLTQSYFIKLIFCFF